VKPEKLQTATTLVYEEVGEMRKTLLNVTSSAGTVNHSNHRVSYPSKSPPREQVKDGHLVSVTFESRAGVDERNHNKRSRSPNRNR